MSLFQSNLRKQIRKLQKILKSVKIIHYCSLPFIRVLRHEGLVRTLAALEGGGLASGSNDYMIKVWEVSTGACVATLDGDAGYVTSLAVLEGNQLASGYSDIRRIDETHRTIKIWDSALSDVLR